MKDHESFGKDNYHSEVLENCKMMSRSIWQNPLFTEEEKRQVVLGALGVIIIEFTHRTSTTLSDEDLKNTLNEVLKMIESFFREENKKG